MPSSKNNVIHIWKAKHERDGEKNLADFIRFARDDLAIYSEQGWDAPSWKPNKGISIVFGFREQAGNNYSPVVLFSSPYLEFVRAFIRQQMSIREISSAHIWISTFRYLYKALKMQFPDRDPCILNINGQALKDTEVLIKKSEENKTRQYQIGGKLAVLVKWLLNENIVLTLPNYKSPFKKQVNMSEQIGKYGDKFREERCPSMDEMLSLAECFSRSETIADKYYTSVLVMLCFAPSRINELGGLTIHSLQQGDDDGWYVVWQGSKGFPSHRKGIPKLMLDVVKKAFQQLIEISKPARIAARWAYENPDHFYRHSGCITTSHHDEDEPLSEREIAYALNILGALHHTNKEKINTPTKWINELLREEKISYRRLNDIVHKKYTKNGWPNNSSSNRPIWENLLLIRELELKPNSAVKEFSWVMPSVDTFNEQLSKKPKKVSTLWERFGMTREDGTPISMTTHQLRVWLNTHAKIGGVDDWKIARWSGRADIKQNAAYDLRVLEHKSKLGNDLLKSSYEDVPSALTLRKLNIPVPIKSLGIDREGIADFTGIGFCTHDFAQTPCTKAGECVTCKDHICLTGLPETLDELKYLEKYISEEFNKACLL